MWVCGIDGCRSGWLVVRRELNGGRCEMEVAASFAVLMDCLPRPAVAGVDMPIGLLDAAAPGGRACDRLARAALGWPRAASVFSPPVRGALRAASYAEALRINRHSSGARLGISRQAYGLFSKLRELDEWMTPSRQRFVFEVHPELAFGALNGGRSVKRPKRSREGRRLRARLLRRHGFAPLLAGAPPAGAARDDLLDACALCWSAERILCGSARRVPRRPPRDARGLRMEIRW
jgi:predicted RNase H-like nuclease